MIREIKHKELAWIDIENPSKEDVQYLHTNFHLHETVLEEIIPPSQRSKVESFDHYIYLVLHFPVLDKATRVSHNRELDIIVTRHAIITSHYQAIVPHRALFDKLNLYTELREEYFKKGIEFILYSLINNLLKSYFPKLDHIAEDIRVIEQQIFKGKQKQMVFEIANVRRNLLSFRQALKPQRSILDSLLVLSQKVFGRNAQPYFEDLTGDYAKVWEVSENLHEILDILENANNALFSVKLNEIMRALTAVSVIFLPPTLLVNFFGMNMPFPISELPHGYLLVLGWTVLMGAVLVLYFKKKGWL